MQTKAALSIYYVYALVAVAAIFCGLLVFHSIIITFILFHVMTCLGIPVFHGLWEHRLRENWQELTTPPSKRGRHDLVEGFGSGIVLMVGTISGFYLMMEAGISVDWIHRVLEEWGINRELLWSVVVYMIVGNSFFEELLWRGFTLERLARHVTMRMAVIVSSLFYASYHIILGTVLFGWRWGLLVAGLAWILGCYWAHLRLKYQSLYTAWMSHMLVDVGIMGALVYWVYS